MRAQVVWLRGRGAVGLLGVAFLLQGAFVAHALAGGITDQEVTAAVASRLMLEQGAQGHSVDVETRDGVVLLRGFVNDILARERAARLAGTVRGVRSVVNDIGVKPVNRPDQEIQAEVESALRSHPALRLHEIRVRVNSGVATLGGKADSLAQWRLSEEIAKGVNGVREVRNRLDYDPRERRPDEEIEREIWNRLVWDLYVDESLLRVNVKDGHVKLAGLVGSGRERWRAYQDAWVLGVKTVDHGELRADPRTQESLEQRPAYVQQDAKEIEEAMRSAIRLDPRLPHEDIRVRVDDGIVTLTGEVESLGARDRAAEDARNTVGVWWVKNHLAVRPAMGTFGHMYPVGSTPYADYFEIRQKVWVALLRDPDVEQHEISVLVNPGRIVRLSGRVDSEWERSRALEVASRVSGVREVVDDIQVGGAWQEKSDPDIKRDIGREFWWSPFVDSDHVRVFVNDGVVTLAGVVDTLEERRAATENAYEAGAKRVRNYLKVTRGPDYYRPIYQGSF